MTIGRRELLTWGLGMGAGLAIGPGVRACLAPGARPREEDDERILVVVQLTGGNDGLNTLIPSTDPVYRASRPTLAVPTSEVLGIDGQLGLHPQLDAMADLLEAGRLAVVPGVGYPGPDRSHFRSMSIWHTARTDPEEQTPGWIHGLLEQGPPSEMPALSVSNTRLPQCLLGGGRQVPALDRAEQMIRRLPEGREREHAVRVERLLEGGSGGGLLAATRRSLRGAYRASERLAALETAELGRYPGFAPLGRRLQLIARSIRAELGPRVYATELDGFDTHVRQARSHPFLLQHLGRALKAFVEDLEEAGQASRVLVMVFSEFGRRLAENGSEGTDHGTAGPVFLAGRPVVAGVHGRAPDLERLVDGDPVHDIDFRRIYATVLEDWMRIPPSGILGGDFAKLPLVDDAG